MQKKRILVVDDEPALTRLLKNGLENTGIYEVREVNRGKRALSAAHQFRPDLILLDVFMGDMDGSEVASQIKEDPSLMTTPIVFLTAIVEKQQTGPEPTVIGGAMFIAKPVDLADLIKCLNGILQP